jgi:F1F0 ATPase subunit 2
MSDVQMLCLSGFAGATLGALFFGGLWWTVRKHLSSARPMLWFVGSLLLRIGIVVAGFAFVSAGSWQRLLACLTGFVMARMIVIRLTRSSAGTRPPGTGDGRCASAPTQ